MDDLAVGPNIGDAFGAGLLAKLAGEPSPPIIIERNDGLVDVDVSDYFGPVEATAHWEWIRNRIRGRVLDIGAGAGRLALGLQDAAHDVTALDVSEGAIEVCRRRGVRQLFHGRVEDLARSDIPERFDTFVGLGANLGLIGTPERAVAFFDALTALGRPGCRVVGTIVNPHGDHADHVEYHERNRAAGRFIGEVTLRIRYRRLATEWFNLLWLSPEELAQVGEAAGWRLVDSTDGTLYAAELAPK
jgi:2-polyprenyl-3-methyl-5-hydroxy-6-metoxy-1,4-benzoquinol methylase